MNRRRLAFAFALWAGCVGVGAVDLGACLPDLGPLREEAETGPAPEAGPRCGDGVIDPGGDGRPAEECDPGDGSLGCTRSCQVDCPGLLDLTTRHCYFVAPQATSLREARQSCEGAGAHMVTFASDREVRSVSGWFPVAAANDDAGFWIGLWRNRALGAYATLHNREPGWQWPDASICTGCFARTPPDSPLFAGDSPDAGVQDCVRGGSLADASWAAMPCDDLGVGPAVVCERESPGRRAQPCTAGQCFRGATRQYAFIASPQPVASAREQCSTLPRGRLATFTSREEREFVAHELTMLRVDRVWIGLERDAANRWSWADGQPETAYPSVWGDFEPKGSGPGHAYLWLDPSRYDVGLAHVADVGATFSFVCEYQP